MPNQPFYQTQAWRDLRLQVLRRDGFRCVWCGADVSGKGAARADHVVPVKEAPHLALMPENVRTLCAPCDNRRHAEKGGDSGFIETGADGFPTDGSWS